ncbi:Copine [Ancylostoma ceylanicum]|uniref:Copine n=1 Tax=Ancylostoma ceylanicum TaxID=53326 RepID=A0A0D6L7Q8_9BILA|nr:Copine [Ancylostoma ceylanicum]
MFTYFIATRLSSPCKLPKDAANNLIVVSIPGLKIAKAHRAIIHDVPPSRKNKPLGAIGFPEITIRALSIPSVRVSPRPLLSPMSHTIEISIAISDLVGVEHLARVNCVLWQNDTESEKNWRHLGTTNAAVVINRSVDFEDKISFKYVFEKAQLIKIDICRLHDGETASGSDDVVGSCIFKVDELIGSFGLQLRRSLLPEGRVGLAIEVFRLEEGKDEDELVLLYESEAIKNHSHPQLLEVWVMYRDVDGSEGYIGKFLTTYAKMKYGPGPDNVYTVINELKQQQKKNYENSGRMELVKFTDVSFFSFLDYINFNIDPICRGLDGVIEAYRKAQSVVSPMKTAKFAPVVNSAIRTSQRSGFRGLHYHVLAIFTRGTPTDIKFITISDILEAGDSPAENRSRIAQKALRAIPEQMADFMHAANIAAKPPIQVCRSPLFHSSSLIPDRPTQFVFDGALPQCLTPQMPRSDRRGSDSQYLDVEIGARNTLTVRVPERCHSVLQTTREQYQRRLKERGLGKMRFPRMDLSTLESSGGSTQDSSL